MPHSFDVFGTPRAERPAGPRDNAALAPAESTQERVGLFHHTRTVAKTGGEEVDVTMHHIQRDGSHGRRDEALKPFVGGSMMLSPERPPSPPLLFRRASKEQPDQPMLSSRRRSFNGGSVVLAETPDQSASDVRAKAEAEQWRQQLEAAHSMPAAGSSSRLG